MTHTTEQERPKREDFEQWSISTNQGYDLTRNQTGCMRTYEQDNTEHAWRGFFHGWLQAARRAPAAPVPQGWKLVPIEPTEAQLWCLYGRFVGQLTTEAKLYSDMLLAAPQPPEAVQAAVPVGTKFFSFDPCDDLVVHDTAEAACAAAQQSIDLYRECAAAEGWAEEVERVSWGMILGQALEIKLSEDLPPDAFAAGAAGSLPPVDYVLHAPAHRAEPETREALAKRLIADVLVADTIATSARQRVAELSDHASPADWPESMLVTGDELHMIVREAVIEAQSANAHPAEGVPMVDMTPAAWEKPVGELLGHISDVLPDDAFDKIDTAKWNAVSTLVGVATTTAAAAPVVLPEPALEILEDAVSILSSINHGKQHAVKVGDEVCYWQRQEWIDWAEKEVLPKLRALLATGGQAQADALDAARYRWLRKSPNPDPACDIALAKHFGGGRGQDFDALIDTAIAAQAKKGEPKP